MMSSSSFTSPDQVINYDVFLSFRGEDTRNNFTSHLFAALSRKKVETFIDNDLIRGDEVSPSLSNAVEGSQISVIIFSKGYAASRWCLEELLKILECKNMYGQIVIPIFYQVDPSDVRNQTGTFGDSFSKLEERFKDSSEKLQTWRTALKEAANLSGWDSLVIRPESVLIEEIVEDVLKRLDKMFPVGNKDLIGIESSMKKIESLLQIGSNDICFVGIWGIGGVGKTTIANAIYKKIFNQFEGSYFAQNVREESEKNGLTRLRKEFLSAILQDRNLCISTPNIEDTFIKERLSRKKVLIVFDDVTCLEQIEILIGDLKFLGSGSRVIITTRDRQVLNNCGVNEIHEVVGLFHHEALQLFSRYAFKLNHPIEDYIRLSNRIVEYTKGVPLALKVLGSSLLGKRKHVWESAVHKLEKAPHVDIQKVLKITYDGLDDEEKNIFLDIACFFKWEDKDLVIKILDASGYAAEMGVSVLIDKCLIIVVGNIITLHDLIQEMGKEIVRQESIKDPGKRSRLWHHEDVYQVLTKNTGTEVIEGISLNMSAIKEMHINPYAFTNMHKLRFIRFYRSPYEDIDNRVLPYRGLKFVLTELRYLHWHTCPLKSLGPKFHPQKLVALEMLHSNVEQLWNGVQNLDKLKRINLSYSEHLTKIPDLSNAPNLESLYLEGCTSLFEIPSFPTCVNKLAVVNLRHCISLCSIPTDVHSKKVILSGCLKIKTAPKISSVMEELHLDGTAIEELGSSIENPSRLKILNLENCSQLENLPSSFYKLKSLKYLYLSGCSKLQKLPENLGNLEALKKLKADGTAIREIPPSIANLCNLDILSFKRCKGKKTVGLVLPPQLNMWFLTDLDLTDCEIINLPDSLGHLFSLQILCLSGNNFERIPTSIVDLCGLSWLDLSYCKRLKSLPELPRNLTDIQAYDCSSLQALSGLSILFSTKSMKIRNFSLGNCFNLDQNELKEILDKAPSKIQRMATLWWEIYSKVYGVTVPCGCFYFPGSEIPEWFGFKSRGSSITLELPPGFFSSNFVGFALCTVVAFGDHQDKINDLAVCYEFELKSKYGYSHFSNGSFLGHYGTRYVEADHVFLGYDFRIYSEDFRECYYENKASIRVNLKDYDSVHAECCKVKMCGVHLFYV